MAVTYLGDGKYMALVADTKPTTAATNAELWETDTGKIHLYNGTAWVPKSLAGGYKYIIYKIGATTYCQDADGETVSSSTTVATPIQYALDNLTVGRTWKETVKLRGDFTVSVLTLPSYVLLDLTEASLTQASATNLLMLSNADKTNGNTDIEIVGGLLDGNKAGQGGGGPGEARSMVFFKNSSRIWLHGGIYQHGNFHNILFHDCPTDIKVTNISSYDPRHEHCSSHSFNLAEGVSHGHIFADSYWENTAVGSPLGNTFITTVNVSDAVVTGNTCIKTYLNTSGITVNGKRSIVANNTVKGAYIGIVIAQLTNPLSDSSGTIITNNLVYDSELHGIAAAVQPGTDVVVSNNIVDTTLGAGSAGIAFSGMNGMTITGNVVKNAFGNGIMVYGSTTLLTRNIVIANNVCYNNCKQPAVADNNAAGIAVRSLNALGDIQYVNVHGNHCFDNQGTKTQKWGVRLSLASNCVVRFNDLRNNLTAGSVDVSGSVNLFGGNMGDLVANPDTSDGVIGTVQTELNQVKATLRAAGLIG
jgi:hypothetical protein